MKRDSRAAENAFKVKELERLLSEDKITLERYLDARTKIENPIVSQNSCQHLPAKQNAVHAENAQPSNVKEPKKPYTKMILGFVLCIIILVGGFFAWGYLNPVYAESLTIESYSVTPFTKGAVLFELKNAGNTNVQISKVKMNGYLNQSIEGWNQGWNGTAFLQPGQTGSIYVYIFCYFYVLNASMPYLSSPPSQTETENLYSWMESFNCTFTFVTDTQHQYNCTVPGLACMIIPAWTGALTYTFMGTEQLQITNLAFLSNDRINITMRNTGTTSITITEIWVNNVKTWTEGIIINPSDQTAVTLDVAWVAGNSYQFKVLTSHGNEFYYTAVAPASSGVVLYKANVNFYGTGTKIDIDIGNSGTSDTDIIKVYVGTSSTALQNQTTIPSLPISLVAGSIVRVTINYTWTAGTTYYFRIVSSTGQTLEFPEQAPTS